MLTGAGKMASSMAAGVRSERGLALRGPKCERLVGCVGSRFSRAGVCSSGGGSDRMDRSGVRTRQDFGVSIR